MMNCHVEEHADQLGNLTRPATDSFVSRAFPPGGVHIRHGGAALSLVTSRARFGLETVRG